MPDLNRGQDPMPDYKCRHMPCACDDFLDATSSRVEHRHLHGPRVSDFRRDVRDLLEMEAALLRCLPCLLWNKRLRKAKEAVNA